MKTFTLIRILLLVIFVACAGTGKANAMYFSDVYANHPQISVADDYPQKSLHSQDNFGNDIMFLAYKKHLKLLSGSGAKDYMSFIPPDMGLDISFKITDVYTSNPIRHFWVISAWIPVTQYGSSKYKTLDFWLVGQDADGKYVCYVNSTDLREQGILLPSVWGINATTWNLHDKHALEISLVDNAKAPSHPIYARWDDCLQRVTLTSY